MDRLDYLIKMRDEREIRVTEITRKIDEDKAKAAAEKMFYVECNKKIQTPVYKMLMEDALTTNQLFEEQHQDAYREKESIEKELYILGELIEHLKK